ncbi:MAG: thiamine pyrophosphate-binding protein [Candidatus Dormibacteraceae bacterium]
MSGSRIVGTVAEAVAAALSEVGLDQVFGVLGSGNFAVTQALVDRGATFIAARHEGGAMVMTDVHSRLTGRVAACSVHQGPGFTNAITGLTEAAKSRTPMLVLAADTPATSVRSNFRIDQGAIATAVGALSERLTSPETAVAEALRAHRRAVVERRPVVLSMPIEILAADASAAAVSAAPATLNPLAPDPAAVATAARLLASAERPLIIAGRGAVLAHARRPLEALGDRAGALLATSAMGHGLFTASPWSLGISGGFASPIAAELIAAADVVVAFGATLNMWTTRHGRLIGPGAALVQVDIDAGSIGANRTANVAVLGDAALTATALEEALASAGAPPAGWRTPALAERIRRGAWPQVSYTDATRQGFIDPRSLTLELDQILPEQRTLAVDSGHFQGWPPMYMRVPDELGFVFTQAFQSIGLGLASAIGAALARPDRLTVAALGDGGMLMGIAELETAVRLGLWLIIVVYNDAAYGAEVHHFAADGLPVDLVRFPPTDIAAIGRGAGARGVTVRRPEDLGQVTDWLATGERGVLVVDAKVDPTVVADWLPEAFGH